VVGERYRRTAFSGELRCVFGSSGKIVGKQEVIRFLPDCFLYGPCLDKGGMMRCNIHSHIGWSHAPGNFSGTHTYISLQEPAAFFDF